jgi:hypothetical protein
MPAPLAPPVIYRQITVMGKNGPETITVPSYGGTGGEAIPIVPRAPVKDPTPDGGYRAPEKLNRRPTEKDAGERIRLPRDAGPPA